MDGRSRGGGGGVGENLESRPIDMDVDVISLTIFATYSTPISLPHPILDIERRDHLTSIVSKATPIMPPSPPRQSMSNPNFDIQKPSYDGGDRSSVGSHGPYRGRKDRTRENGVMIWLWSLHE